MINLVFSVMAVSICDASIFKVSNSASIKTGFKPYCSPGFTVVGNATEQVINSSPDLSRLSPNTKEVSEAKATKFAEDPELTSETYLTPRNFLNSCSNNLAQAPSVHHPSLATSIALLISSWSNTLPETGTYVSPGINCFIIIIISLLANIFHLFHIFSAKKAIAFHIFSGYTQFMNDFIYRDNIKKIFKHLGS